MCEVPRDDLLRRYCRHLEVIREPAIDSKIINQLHLKIVICNIFTENMWLNHHFLLCDRVFDHIW